MEKIEVLAESLPLIYGFDLTAEEREEFDYLESEELDSSQFFRHNNQVYALHNFLRFNHPSDWDGHEGTSYFSANLVKLSPCGESVKLGRATS